jgi:hypothetical protein
LVTVCVVSICEVVVVTRVVVVGLVVVRDSVVVAVCETVSVLVSPLVVVGAVEKVSVCVMVLSGGNSCQQWPVSLSASSTNVVAGVTLTIKYEEQSALRAWMKSVFLTAVFQLA